MSNRKKVKLPKFSKEFFTSTIGSYLVCQEKLKSVSIWHVMKMWKKFMHDDDLKHATNYPDFIHWIDIYFNVESKETIPIVAVYSETTENIIHCLFYDNTLIPASDLPVATLMHPSKVWDLKGKFIDYYEWYDWKGVKHTSKEGEQNVSEEEKRD